MTKPIKRVHVTPNKEQGGWNVKPEHQGPVSHHRTQEAALEVALQNLPKGGELITHGRNNLIRESDTIPPAKDPFPPRG